ncbi:MAG: cupin domain-containing protein [Lachnospiraceae bacterium]|nr:cupin domain-containing protein [Lachnospiraceae bacterium]
MKKVFENEVAVIPADEINGALKHTFRQYIQGNLKQDQDISFIRTGDSEIGISDYKEYSHDDPHYHDKVMETNYVISGKVCMRIIDTNEDYVIEAGGVFSIPPHVKHVLKIKAGTRIIFVKTPSINDKHVLDFDELDLNAWFEDEDF